jgi:carboxyl-terminal processing protease
MSLVSRRVLRGAGLVLAGAALFASGVLTGVVGSSSPSGVIDEAAARIQATAARPVDRQQLERAAVEGMLKALGDRWSAYYTPSSYRSFAQALEGRYSGVGLWVRQSSDPEHGPVIASVQPSSPAAAAGLQSGDVLVSVGGHSTASLGVGEVVGLLRGADGSTVDLVVDRGGAPIAVTLTRVALSTDDVVVEQLAGGVTRVEIRAFTRGVGREVRDALGGDRDTYAGGVILDLRSNPGGLLDEAVEVASQFLDGGPVVSYEQRNAPDKVIEAVGVGDTTTPVVVLVDGGTASAAEVVTAALQDRNRAVVVGSRTYGKGSVQVPTELSDGSAIELTVGRYFTPTGRSIDGRGIEPDVLVDPTASPEVAEQRALEVLQGLMAALPPSSG